MTVDFVKTGFEGSFAVRCSEDCCALQGQRSEVPICNVNRLGKPGLALLSAWESWNLAVEFSDPPFSVRILALAEGSSHFPRCQMLRH